MAFVPKIATLFFPFFLLVLNLEHQVPSIATQQSQNPTLEPANHDDDTTKYRGYRLDLTNFEVLRRTDDWVKLRFDVVNSGRMNVNFAKKGTEHWVQVNFDQSLFDNKLGGLRQNIRQAMYDEGFKLEAGQTKRQKELKVLLVLPKQKEDVASSIEGGFFTNPAAERTAPQPPVEQTEKGGNEEGTAEAVTETKPAANSTPAPSTNCPDVTFQGIRIVEQDAKWATIEYIIENKGTGTFYIFDKDAKPQERLVVKAFISGVPTLSKGALELGGQLVKPKAGQPTELQPGDSFTGRMKVDVRQKTRYMKSLILSLDSDQFRLECNKTNNTSAVILD